MAVVRRLGIDIGWSHEGDRRSDSFQRATHTTITRHVPEPTWMPIPQAFFILQMPPEGIIHSRMTRRCQIATLAPGRFWTSKADGPKAPGNETLETRTRDANPGSFITRWALAWGCCHRRTNRMLARMIHECL